MKISHIISICLAIAVLSFSISLAVIKSSRDFRQIQKEGVLRIIVEENSMSFVIKKDSSITGLQYKMIKKFASDFNLKLEFIHETNLDSAIKMLQNEDVDILVWHIPVHNEMRDRVDFSIPVFKGRQILVQRKMPSNGEKQTIRNQLNLAKKTIYIPLNSPYKQRINNLAKEIGDTIHIQEIKDVTPKDLFKMINEGKIDFTVCDESVAEIEKRHFPNLDIQTAISFTQNYSWGLRKSSPVLKNTLNEWLSRYLDSEEYNALHKKYTEN